MSRTRCYTFECRTCAERIVLPYRHLQLSETQYYWPSGEDSLNFMCTQHGVVDAYVASDVRAEPLLAMAPAPLGCSLWKVSLKCDHTDCGVVLSVHLKVPRIEAGDSLIRTVLNSSGTLRCANGHV